MARVQVSGQPWGTLWDRSGNVIPGQQAEINTPIYADATGETELEPSLFVADVNGRLPGFVDEGDWTLTVGTLDLPAPALGGTLPARADAGATAAAAVVAEAFARASAVAAEATARASADNTIAAAAATAQALAQSVESGSAWEDLTEDDVLTIDAGIPAWRPPSGGASADASATVKGLTKLSIAPASPTAPIALGANEKGAVGGVATLDAVGRVPAGQIPVVRPVPAVGARSFLPNGVKLRGANLVVKPSHPLTNSGFTNQGAWARYYEEWDWTGWIKPQIDRAIYEGMNGIRQIGDVFGLKLGYYSEATYLAHWAQLIEYCAANNLYVYATGGSELHFGGASYAEVAAYIAAYASFVNQYPNVIALDVLQEIPDATSGRIANLKIVRDACKAANPNLPMTFSMAAVNGFNAVATVQALDPIVDFFDGHGYSTVTELSLNNIPGSGYYTSTHPKPLMIGEFGASQSQSSGQRVAHAKSFRDWFASHPSVIGCLYWALADQDVAGAPANTWGLFTNARTTLNNGAALSLPAATITVVSTAGAGTQDSPAFPSSGTFELGGNTIAYTGKTAVTFTGCTGGAGSVPDGTPIYVRRADVADVLRTFPERVAPLIVERILATDTAISAPNTATNLAVGSVDLRFPIPMLCEMIATADIDILTAGNVYSLQISAPGGQTMDGTTLTVPKAVGGGVASRITLTTAYAVRVPAGYNVANFTCYVGHVSGSAADAVAKATNTRCKWTLTPL